MVERWVRSGDRTEALLTMHGRPWYRFLAESDPESGTKRLVTTAYSPARPGGALPTSSREIVITTDSAVVREAVGGEVLSAFPVARGTSLVAMQVARLASVDRLVLPGVNHLLLADPVGDPGLYFTLPDRRLAARVTSAIVAWLAARWP